MERDIVSTFVDAYDAFGFDPIDPNADVRLDWAESAMMHLLKQTFDTLSTAFELTDEGAIDTFCSEQRAVATEVARLIDPNETANIERLRARDRFLEARSFDDRRWIVKDVHLDLPTVVDAHSSPSGPIGLLRAEFHDNEIIRELSRDTGREWNPAERVWTFYLDTLDELVNVFCRENRTIRIVEPVARLSDTFHPQVLPEARPVGRFSPQGLGKRPSVLSAYSKGYDIDEINRLLESILLPLEGGDE